MKKIGTLRVEKGRAIQGQKDMRKTNIAQKKVIAQLVTAATNVAIAWNTAMRYPDTTYEINAIDRAITELNAARVAAEGTP